MKTTRKHSIPSGVAACSMSLSGGSDIQLFPAGEFRAWDGRPRDVKTWRMDAAIAAAVIADYDRFISDRVIDYDHQTLLSAQNGQPAPAAGWLGKLEWRGESGLWAVGCSWTPKATDMIAAGEYRYMSPVFTYDKQTGAVQRVLMAAITNNPGLDGMSEVALSALLNQPQPQKENTMDIEDLLESLRWLLNLPTLATPDDITAELKKAIDLIKQGNPTEAASANFKLTALLADKDARIAALTAAPDPAKFVSVATMSALQQEVAALRANVLDREVSGVVSDALANGKLLPAQKDWATSLGRSNLAALTAYLDTAQPIAALSGTQTGGRQVPGEASGALTDVELAVCNAMGITPADFAKTKAAIPA